MVVYHAQERPIEHIRAIPGFSIGYLQLVVVVEAEATARTELVGFRSFFGEDQGHRVKCDSRSRLRPPHNTPYAEVFVERDRDAG